MTGPAKEPERVRACPECGNIVPFVERTCPSCGYEDPVPDIPVGGPPAGPCPACAAPVVAGLLFCAQCGAEREPPPPAERPHEVDEERDALPIHVAAVVLTLLGPFVLLLAVLSVYLYGD